MAQDFQEQDDPNVVWGTAPDQTEPVISRWNPFLMLKWVAICGGFLTVAAVGVAYLVYSHNESSAMKKKMNEMEDRLRYAQQSSSQVPPTNDETSRGSAPSNDVPRPASRDEYELRILEKLALSKVALGEFEDQLNRLDSDYQDLIDTRKEIQEKFDAFLSGEVGKRVASDEKLILQFQILQNQFRLSCEKELKIPTFVADMSSIVSAAKLKPEVGFEMKEDSLAKLTSFSSQIKPIALAENDVLIGLNSLSNVAANLPTGDDLATAIEKLQFKKQQLQFKTTMQKIEMAEKKADDEFAEQVASARYELQASKNALDLAEIEAKKLASDSELERKMQETQNRLADAKKKAADDKLRAEYASSKAEIQRYLTPFTSEGRKLRGDLGGKGPVSYAVILGSGALEENDEGLLALFTLGGARDQKNNPRGNDRPGGGFPVFDGGNMSHYPAMYDYLEKAQGFLKKYGTLMVEDGLLAK